MSVEQAKDRPAHRRSGSAADSGFTRETRAQVMDMVVRTVEERLFDPSPDGKDWARAVTKKREQILDAPTPERFTEAIRQLLSALDIYPLDFFHEQAAMVPFYRAVKATLHSYGNGWMFQDVHADGPADRNGIRPGDQLIAVDGVSVHPPGPVMLPAGRSGVCRITNSDGATREISMAAQTPGQGPPVRYVIASKLEPNLGLLKISMFPGLVGIDMAHAIDQAVATVSDCERLIIDLRGNPGGGSANLRLMSYMHPGKAPVGYSLTKARARAGYRREELPQFRGIPSSKLALIWLALRFKWVDKSIVVVTEGLGRQAFHGRMVLLVNEHTSSGAEIVAGFAREHRLATIVGARTAGRLLGWSSFPVGNGFRLTLPVSNYVTWDGQCFEKSGVAPDIEELFRPEVALAGGDNQLDAAVRAARSL